MPNWIYYFMPHNVVNKLEKRRLTYALWVISGLGIFFILVLIVHTVCKMTPVHYYADAFGLIGAYVAASFIRKNKLVLAVKTIVITLLVAILVYGPIVDYVEPGTVMFLRLYVTIFALEAALLLMVSFYIAILNYVYLALLFTSYLLLHFFVIVSKNGWDTVTPEMISYGIIGVLAINISCFIASLMLRYNNDLMNKINADNKEIVENNIRLEAEVKNRTGDLQNSNDNLKQFAHIVWHELNEPLRTISGFSGLLQKKLDNLNVNDPDIKDYTQTIQNSSRHMANLVKEMLTFSSVQQSPKTLVEIKMNELVELVLNQIDNIVQEKKAEITWTALPNAYGESLLVFQLMQNLIINGIKYQPKNNTPKITISGSPKGQFIEYIVTDNGIGMSNDTLLKIFDPLYREHKHEYGDGTGMGLSICKKIVDAHHGKIWVSSELSTGTCFHFTLPAYNMPIA